MEPQLEEQNNTSLLAAIKANNLQLVTSILKKTADPFAANTSGSDDEDDRTDNIARTFNAALRRENHAIIMTLLQNASIRDYLSNAKRDNYTFTQLNTLMAKKQLLRAGSEIIAIASNGKAALLPAFLCKNPQSITTPPPVRHTKRNTIGPRPKEFNEVEGEILQQRKSMLHQFTQVREFLGKNLPAPLVMHILDYAVSDTDYADLPICKADIVGWNCYR